MTSSNSATSIMHPCTARQEPSQQDFLAIKSQDKQWQALTGLLSEGRKHAIRDTAVLNLPAVIGGGEP